MDDETRSALLSLEERLNTLENILAELRQANRLSSFRQPTGLTTAAIAQTSIPQSPTPSLPPVIKTAPEKELSPSQLMAWGAGAAFVLAAIYFLKLVYDMGWLTPARQAVLAVLAGLSFIASGQLLARRDKEYAAYLPAIGAVILYAAVYTAHGFYHILSLPMTVVGVVATTATTLWLHRKFAYTIYALFAVVGSYLLPLFAPEHTGTAFGLILYYTTWCLVFCGISIWEGRRSIYLLAMYFGIIGFDIIWRTSAPASPWYVPIIYQCVQFLLLTACTGYYSVKWKAPLSHEGAVVHAGALFYFYFSQYLFIRAHNNLLAPWFLLGSALIVLLAFFFARRLMSVASLQPSALLVSGYCSLAVTHGVFFELISDRYFPWAALFTPFALWGLHPKLRDFPTALKPPLFAAGFVYLLGLINVLILPSGADVPALSTLLLLYAAMLYTASWLFFKKPEARQAAHTLLYVAHFTFMLTTTKLLTSGLAISAVWAIFSVALLGIALSRNNRLLARSSLLIFAASGGKAILFDLAGTSHLVRVAVLAILGVSLYIGGYLYRRIEAEASSRQPLR